jgi:hypothetical protein
MKVLLFFAVFSVYFLMGKSSQLFKFSVDEVQHKQSIRQKISFVWIVDNYDFVYHQGTGVTLTSDYFDIPVIGGKLSWYVKVDGKTFYIYYDKTTLTNPITVGPRKFVLFNSSESILYETSGDKLWSGKPSNYWSLDFMSDKELDKYFSTSASKTIYLLFTCEIVTFDVPSTANQIKYFKLISNECSWFEDVGNKLLEDTKYCDVDFITPDKSLKCAHKVIIATKAPELLTNNQGPDNKTFTLNNMKSNTLQSLLEYIYTDKLTLVNLTKDNLIDLLLAANKYKLTDLQEALEYYLLSSVNIDTVLDYMKLAQDHQMKSLKKQLLDFIRVQASIMPDSEWKKLLDKIIKGLY